MNIHLLPSPELNKETYRNVLNLLQQFRGPLKFLECEQDVLSNNSNEEERGWGNKKDFETSLYSIINHDLVNKKKSNITFPYFEKVITWDQMFSQCEEYRSKNNLPEGDLVVLLTDVGNEPNWFGGISPSMKNYFVQTSNWEYFFGSSIDIRFPIAYQVIVWVMNYYMFPSKESFMKNIHDTPIGCIMDFCQDKTQIILKMRTADICENCINTLINRDVPPLHIRQIFEILDGIRLSMTFRGRSKLFQQPSRMEIKGYTKNIFFSDLGNLELDLNPKEKALYLLFLNHREGIRLTELQDHKEELKEFYVHFCNQSNPEIIQSAIDRLVDPTGNDMNVVLSRINNKIKDAVGDYLLDFYGIKGERGEIKLIKLDRELLI
jgi:hypothetical protein